MKPTRKQSSKKVRRSRTREIAATMALVNAILLGGASAPAQEPSAPAAASSNAQPPIRLPEVVVTGDEGYKADTLSLSKYSEPLVSTPRSASVVTQQLIQDEAVTSLRDSLRNVSGISIGAGEGSYQGDNFSIRGFAARSDIFLDGMTDFGSYDRDPFNTEQIEVLKGPSSTEFGRGSSGGVVNQDSKQPDLHGFVAGSAVYGTDNTQRATLDVDEPIRELPGASFRLNLMGDRSDVAERNDANYARWGIAPSVSFGIGSPTRIVFSYFHQSEDNTPDYGIPWLNDRPAPVSRENYYGFKSDHLETDVNIGTLRVEHDFNEHLTLRDQFRVGSYYRAFRISQADTGDILPDAPLHSASIARDIIDGASTDKLIDEDVSLLAKFDTGPLSHALVVGFEFVHQSVDPRRVEPGWEDVPDTSLLFPDENQKFTGHGPTSTVVNAHVDTLSAYLIHTMKIGKQWTIIGGGRFDNVSSGYFESVDPKADFAKANNLLSWRAAVVFQPLPNGSLYISSGTSVHPNIQQLSISSEPTLPPSTSDVGVGTNFEVETGTKWELFTGRLLLTGAFFWDEQTNPAPVDLDDPLIGVFNGRERVWGIELGMVGRLTDKWQVLLNYTYGYGKITSSSDPTLIGHPVLNAPKNTVSLWTTYDLPWRLQAGFGLNAVSSRTASESPDPANGLLMEAPGYVILSAMLKYQINRNVDLQANVENLTDQYYYDGVHPGHVVPGPGRALYISTNFKF